MVQQIKTPQEIVKNITGVMGGLLDACWLKLIQNGISIHKHPKRDTDGTQ
jgi:predicted RNase H-like HicB family nuclease